MFQLNILSCHKCYAVSDCNVLLLVNKTKIHVTH
jgi:hypothetical protein